MEINSWLQVIILAVTIVGVFLMGWTACNIYMASTGKLASGEIEVLGYLESHVVDSIFVSGRNRETIGLITRARYRPDTSQVPKDIEPVFIRRIHKGT